MLKVYLDNNILVDIEDGDYALKDFLAIPEVEYYYSDAHIAELLNGVEKSIDGLEEKRLATIKALCDNKFLVQDAPGFSKGFALCNPQQAYENANEYDYMRVNLNCIVSSNNFNRKEILENLNLNIKEVGNIDSSEILNVIDEKFRKSKYRCSIIEYLIYSEAYTGRAIYSSLFNLLDMVGYRKDKNNVARLYDSSHAYYAQLCDILVSNDSRMRIKTKAVYHYLNVSTQVMDANEFLGTDKD